jgi:two-component system NtrC family sensor kinase
MLGYSAEALRGMVFAGLFRERRGGTAPVALQDELRSGAREQYRVDGYGSREDGELVYVNLTVASLGERDGARDYAVAMVEDVTERVQAREAMMHAERLTVAGRLAASLAHEISNPLQSIIGAIGLAREELAEGRITDEYLSMALDELRRLADLVGRMRDLHRPPSPEAKELVDANGLLVQVLALTRRRCEESGVTVDWRPGRDLPDLLLATDQLRQVFLNLMLNALDAMPDGGNLLVETAHTAPPGGVLMTVADDGAGIKPDVLSHIFEPFHSTKPDGMGIGLFISQEIVKGHGGWIEVASEEGKGTTFTVWLPAPDQVT